MKPAPARRFGVALAAASSLLVLAQCSKEASCRPDTLFVRVQLGDHASANRLDVDTSIDGAAPRRESLTLPAGVPSGGVEVRFPGGYPEGKRVDVTLTLSSPSGELARRTAGVVLPAGCAALDIDFGSGDGGGADAPRGSGGASGPGSGGATGTGGGAVGSGGAAPGTGGAAPGTGGAAPGTGGAAPGTGGAAPGTGGAAPGTGGAGGSCVRTGAESCFNNRDDDCDGYVDCADTDCAAGARCVPFDPAVGAIGLSTPSGSTCPTDFSQGTAIMAGLTPGGCSGCSCAPYSFRCTAALSGFQSIAACASGVGDPAGTLSSTDPCTKPPWTSAMFGQIYGVVASTFTPSPASGSCTPTGTPSASTPSWANSARFCAAPVVGGGCAPRQACVPLNASAVCQMSDGARACPTGTQRTDWYTGYQGASSCAACTCGAASGASCASMTITVGSDYVCTGVGGIGSGPAGKICFGRAIYEPGVQFSGTPTPASCTAQTASVVGTLAPTGPKTICCQ